MLHISNISALLKHGKLSFFSAFFLQFVHGKTPETRNEIQDTTTQGAGKTYHIGRQRFGFHLVQPWRAKGAAGWTFFYHLISMCLQQKTQGL